jgi:hypothetical protein
MKDRDVTLDRLAFGATLEGVMLQAGLSRREMATRLGRSETYISRLLSGFRGGQARGVIQWLDQCDVQGERRLEILRMRRPCGTCGCRCDHTGLLRCCEAAPGNYIC